MKIDKELTLDEQDLLLRMKAQGKSGQEIANYFNAEKGKDVLNGQDVIDFVGRRRDNAVKVMQEKGQIDEKLANQYFDSINQLNALNKEAWEIITNLKGDPEYKQSTVICPACKHQVKVSFRSAAELIKALDHVMKQIEHVDKVLNRLKTSGLNITYNITELTQQLTKVMPDILESYEKKGEIKIKKKKILVREEFN